MELLIGTAAGAFALEGATTRLLGEASRINHLARHGEDWWAVDGMSRVQHNGEVVASAGEALGLTCIRPSGSVVWVGATGARLFRVDGDHLVEEEGFAAAPGRDRWYTPWGGPPDVRSMSLDASGALLVNVHVGGILRLDEDGIIPTIDQEADVHQVLAHPERPGAVVAASARGLARSGDGRRYQTISEGLHASYCRAVAFLDDTVLVSASTGPRTDRGRLYRIPWDGDRLEACRDGLPEWFGGNVDTHCIVGRDRRFYAGWESTIWASPDLGRSWHEAASRLPRITCLA